MSFLKRLFGQAPKHVDQSTSSPANNPQDLPESKEELAGYQAGLEVGMEQFRKDRNNFARKMMEREYLRLLSSGAVPKVEIVKGMVKESNGARDFKRLITKVGFYIANETTSEIKAEDHDSHLIFSINTTQDTIHSLNFTEKGKPSVCLVQDGKMVF